ncbi:DNA polymerase III, delta prime subunit [Luteimonas sp. J16]|uniref:DNA polymerase III subunit delta' n=1 Tax=unclassified Luteimonas TaxID=2629088 RepID=UPI0004789D58|nr:MULTISPECIES: DNA polymerase III subunit delta' [unclassified Luteimonas]TWG94534.1 DNA polymerase III, delta prime subunit [Luteimonas sp. J16]
MIPELAPWQQRAYDQAVATLAEGRLGHALLLCGPARLGKRAVAEALARYVLCQSRGADGRACGTCRSCRLFEARSQRDPVEVRPDGSLAHPWGHSAHPDYILVGYEWRLKPSPPKPRTEIVIDQVRELSERLALSAEHGARIAIVEPADAVNYNAWNAILKTLEEPQPGRYLWLVASNPSRLPATICSRCQRLEMRMPPRDEALAWLRAQGHAESAAQSALDAARGHPGLADAWLRDGGLALRKEVAADLARIARGEAAPIETAQRWAADEDAPQRLYHAADLALAEAAGLTDPARIRKLAEWFDAANRTRDLLRTTVRADLAIAELLVAWRAGPAQHAPGQERGRNR